MMMPGAQKNPVAAVTPAGGSVHQGNMRNQYAAVGAAVKSGDSATYNASQAAADARRAASLQDRTVNEELMNMARAVVHGGVQDAPRGPMTQSQRAQLFSAMARAALYEQLPTKGQHVGELAAAVTG